MPADARAGDAARDPEAAYLLIGIRRAAGKHPPNIAFLVDTLAHPSEFVSGQALKRLLDLLPMAALPERWYEAGPAPRGERDDIPAWIRAACAGWGGAGDLADLCAERAAAAEGGEAGRLLKRLAVLPGLRRTLIERLRATGRTGLAWRYGRAAARQYNLEYPKQFGFFPTLACQLNCPYCVSAGVALGPDNTMPFDRARELLDWARRDGVERLCLTGGEPTIYPHFGELLAYCRAIGMEVLLATNGLGTPETTGAVIRTRTESVTFHLTPEVLRAPALLRTYKENARRLLEAGIYTAMRCNVETPADDYRPYLDVARELGFREIRTAVPIPNADRRNRYVPVADLAPFGALLGRLASDTLGLGMDLKLAKPFPLCRLPEQAARLFVGNGSMNSNCPVAMQGFSHNMIVHPDLAFSPCLALNAKSPSALVAHRGLRDAARTYRAQVMQLMRRPLLEGCGECPLYHGGRCLGACLSYRLDDATEAGA